VGALPFLESLAPASRRAAGRWRPKRFLALDWSCGIPAIGDLTPSTLVMNGASLLLMQLMSVRAGDCLGVPAKRPATAPTTLRLGAFLTARDFANGKINRRLDR